jgi:hypothetical protein
MKTIIALAGCMVWSVASFAQVEQDDLYFNKKDRAKLGKERAENTLARADKALTTRSEKPAEITSSRNTNPEYISRSQSEMVSGDEGEAYFIENYQQASQNQFNQFNNNLNTWNNNPMYSNAYFAPSINNWNSPYYSPYNDPFLTNYNNNPWYDPFYSSGWSVSFNSFWGNPWNYGWGRPFIGYSICWNSCGPAWAYGGGYWNNFYGNSFYGGGYYPSNIIVVGENYRGPVYGKRSSRGQQTANSRSVSSNGTGTNSRSYVPRSKSSSSNGGGSVNARPQSTRSPEYYTPQWRRTPQQPTVDGQNNSRTDTYQNRTTIDVFNNRTSGNQPQQRSGSYNAPSQRSSGSSTTPSRSPSGGGSSRSRSRDN